MRDEERAWEKETEERLDELETRQAELGEMLKELHVHNSADQRQKLSTVVTWMEGKEAVDHRQNHTIKLLLFTVSFLLLLLIVSIFWEEAVEVFPRWIGVNGE